MKYQTGPEGTSATRGAGIRAAGKAVSRIYNAVVVGLIIAAGAGSFGACSQGAEDDHVRGVGMLSGGGEGEGGASGGSLGGMAGAGTAGSGTSTGSGAACVEGSKKD